MKGYNLTETTVNSLKISIQLSQIRAVQYTLKVNPSNQAQQIRKRIQSTKQTLVYTYGLSATQKNIRMMTSWCILGTS